MLAVLVGAYVHGRLSEKARAAHATYQDDGRPVTIPREAANWLAGCEHVSLPVAATRELAEALGQAVTGGAEGRRTLSWCPICQAVYSPPEFQEHHRADCPRERALTTIRVAMAQEPA